MGLSKLPFQLLFPIKDQFWVPKTKANNDFWINSFRCRWIRNGMRNLVNHFIILVNKIGCNMKHDNLVNQQSSQSHDRRISSQSLTFSRSRFIPAGAKKGLPIGVVDGFLNALASWLSCLRRFSGNQFFSIPNYWQFPGGNFVVVHYEPVSSAFVAI